MESWLLGVLTLATVEMLLSLILSGLVIYMTIYKTPPVLKHFSHLLLLYSAVDAIGAFGGWLAFNQRIDITYSDGLFLSVFVSYGVCGHFGPYFCFVVETMNYVPLVFNLILTTFNMGYRLYLLHNKAPSFCLIAPFLMVIAGLFISVAIHTLSFYAPPSLILPLFSVEQLQLYDNYTVCGQLIVDDWMGTIWAATGLYPFFCSTLALIFRWFIIKTIGNMGRGVSTVSYHLHKEVVWVLTIQSCCPLLITIAAFILLSSATADTTHPFFQTLAYPIMAITVITDAVVSLCFVAPYRRVINKWLKRSKATTVVVSWPQES